MEMQKTITYKFSFSERETARLSEALYVAISNKDHWDATEADVIFCESIINAIGKVD